MSRRLGPLLLDALLLALLALWFVGGVNWHGHVILRHGADPRRTAIILAAIAAWAWPSLWGGSVILRGAERFWSWLETRRGRRVALAGGFALACAIGCLQALALQVPMFDVGLFHQILWALAHGHGFVSTISGAGNFLVDHLAPSLVLLVPAYWVSGSSPLVLGVVQPALLFAGVAAWVWLAENLGAGSWLPAAATLFGLVFDSLWGNLHWGFHENAIAFAALSWAFALAIARPGRKFVTLALFVVAAGSKEILLVDVALAFLAWAWIERERSRPFARVLVALAGALLAIFVGFEKLPHPADKNYFDRYYSYLGHGLGGFFRTLLLSPWVVVSHVGAAELLRYFVTVFLPWLFLPLAAWRYARRESVWLIALLPSLASAALATYPPLRGSGFHYVLELWPVLAAITLTVLARLPSSRRFAIAWALLALLAWDHDPWGDLREYARGAVDSAPVRLALGEIPTDAAVSADELTGPWLAGRLEVTRWPALEELGGHCPVWLALRGPDAMEKAKEVCGTVGMSTRQIGDWHFVQTRSL